MSDDRCLPQRYRPEPDTVNGRVGRPRLRYAGDPCLSWASVDHTHGPLHRVVAGAVISGSFVAPILCRKSHISCGPLHGGQFDDRLPVRAIAIDVEVQAGPSAPFDFCAAYTVSNAAKLGIPMGVITESGPERHLYVPKPHVCLLSDRSERPAVVF